MGRVGRGGRRWEEVKKVFPKNGKGVSIRVSFFVGSAKLEIK